jgi:DNA-binding response OmpR family regulator
MVIEDEKEIRDLVRYNLERAGFRVATAADGEEGLQRLFSSRPDAVVLDLMLPGRNGLEVLKELRAEPTTKELPVIVLTARGAEMDKLLGFEHGADDYLTKPFSPRELVARVRTILRRVERSATASPVVRLGDVEIEAASRKVRVGGEAVHVTPTEFDLLTLLAGRPGVVFTRERLLADVWGYRDGSGTRTVDSHVRSLRRKLGHDVVRTVHGVGYAADGDTP